MDNNKINDELKVKKGFFARLLDKLDKKMEAKAKSSPCCCKTAQKKDKSCCS